MRLFIAVLFSIGLMVAAEPTKKLTIDIPQSWYEKAKAALEQRVNLEAALRSSKHHVDLAKPPGQKAYGSVEEWLAAVFLEEMTSLAGPPPVASAPIATQPVVGVFADEVAADEAALKAKRELLRQKQREAVKVK